MAAKSKLKANAEECTVLFEIEVPKETISQAFVDVYKEIAKVANIPGFRIGKAPLELVKKQYAGDAHGEVLRRLIPEAYKTAVQDGKIEPMGLPEITDVDLKDESPLLFKAKVDTRPKIKVKDYKGIKVEKRTVAVKDEDVAKTLENLREINAKYVAVEDRPVALGDYVVADLECMVDGAPVHKKRENAWVSVEKDGLIPELHEKMAGMKKAEEREIAVMLPEKYPDAKYAKKPAVYRVKVKEIKVRVLPALDNEFAKDLGKDTLEAVHAQIKLELERRAKANADVDMENQLLGTLVKENSFAVPASFIERQLKLMVENAKERLMSKGFKKDELDKKDAEFRAKFKDDAVRQVRLLFILDEIAKSEGIEAADDEMTSAYQSISAQTKRSEKEVRAYYEKEDLVDNLREKIREQKTIAFLLKNADVVEKSN